MGLTVTHNAYNGPYSSFNDWRRMMAKLAGLPPLDFMEGFYTPIDDKSLIRKATLFNHKIELSDKLIELDKQLPIKWDALKERPILTLLQHSDCEGSINWRLCKDIADELSDILRFTKFEDDYYKPITLKFIKGLRSAYENKENLEFH